MTEYQENFSDLHPEIYFDLKSRRIKAQKMLRIISDHLGSNLDALDVLDVGCSTGSMAHILDEHFGTVTGIDIDTKAVSYAQSTFGSSKVKFLVADAMKTGLDACSFDVVICAHVYEHVPDARRMLAEISRLLRPGGVCYFAAENKLVFREGDYQLPFLSVLPKFLAHRYLRFMGKGDFYYEKLMTYWSLRKITNQFERIDYTIAVIRDPEAFSATDVVAPGSCKQRVGLLVARYAYWMFPDYLWLLRKPEASDGSIEPG